MSSLFFLDYDLRKQRDYKPLYAELARFSAKRLLESSWCLNANGTAEGVRDHFKKFVDADDGLWVAQVTDWATYNTTATPKALTSA